MRGLEDIVRQNREVAELGGKVGDLQLPAGVGYTNAFHIQSENAALLLQKFEQQEGGVHGTGSKQG